MNVVGPPETVAVWLPLEVARDRVPGARHVHRLAERDRDVRFRGTTPAAPFAGEFDATEGGRSNGHAWKVETVLRGAGAAAVKSALFWSVSMQPAPLRCADVVFSRAGRRGRALEEVRAVVADEIDDLRELRAGAGRRPAVAGQTRGSFVGEDHLPAGRGHDGSCRSRPAAAAASRPCRRPRGTRWICPAARTPLERRGGVATKLPVPVALRYSTRTSR